MALYTHTTRASGLTLTAAIYNTDHTNHITNSIPTAFDDYSANVGQMQTVADPGEVGTESLATDLAGELARIRFMLKEITGEAQWYVTATDSISGLAAAAGHVYTTTSIKYNATGAAAIRHAITLQREASNKKHIGLTAGDDIAFFGSTIDTILSHEGVSMRLSATTGPPRMVIAGNFNHGVAAHAGVNFQGRNANLEVINYTQLTARALDTATGVEDGVLDIETFATGTLGTRFSIARGMYASGLTDQGHGIVNALDFYKDDVQFAPGNIVGIFTTTGIALASGTNTQAHGFAGAPQILTYALKCIVATEGWSIGDEMGIAGEFPNTDGGAMYADGTNVYMVQAANTPHGFHKTTGATFTCATGSWRFIIKAMRVS